MSVRRRLAIGVAAIAGAAGIAGCGDDDDFANEPRPPAPIEVTARIGKEVVVSPDRFGAGIVNFTVSNQSSKPATLTLEGPTEVTGTDLPPGTVGTVKAEMRQGEYEVSAGEDSDARPTKIRVGRERPSSKNDLLLP